MSFLWCLPDSNNHHSEPQFPVAKPQSACAAWAYVCVCVCVFTSRAFPKCPETFLFEDLPKAVDDSVVCGLACSGCYLEPGLDDISRGHQRGRGHAWGDVPGWTKPRSFILHRLAPAGLRPGWVSVFKVWCDESRRGNYDTTTKLSRCVLPAIAPAASSCKAPSFPSSSAIFSLLWA